MKLRDLLTINSKLPIPKQRIVANLHTIEFTINLKCRAEVDVNFNETTPFYFKIDEKKIYVGPESTYFAETKTSDEDCLFIGAGFLPKPQPNHIPSPFSQYLWATEFEKQTTPIIDRNGWCCTIGKNRPHRNMVCDVLRDKYSKELMRQGDYWFCYDESKNYKELEKFMFRKPWVPNYAKKYITEKPFYHEHPARQLGPWHYKSMIELVPETFYDFFEISEKTVKPISARMPFVSVASYHFLYGLKKMGFKTFHPYIDESYDNEKNTSTRVEMAVDAMFRFVANPTHLDIIQKICDHNHKVLDRIRSNNFFCHVAKKIQKLITF